MDYLLGIDFGGSASKATLLDTKGKVVGISSVEYPTAYPQPGWVEQNPTDWYEVLVANVQKLFEETEVSAASIVAVCLDAPTHTAVLLDEQNRILRPAIYWTDRRSVAQVKYLQENYDELIVATALHKVDTIWTLPQLLWVKENEPDIWERVARVVFAKDYIRYMLTGEFFTDFIEAQGSMLFDCHTKTWSRSLCDLVELDIPKLPPVISPVKKAGAITRIAAEQTGLCAGTPVICGSTDTALEVFAAGAVNLGQMTVKLATAGRICVITDRPWPDVNLVNYSHVVPGLWYPGTATKSCAASYRWYRDTFGEDYKALDEAASSVPSGSQGLLFHPYLAGELTPYADPLLAASFTGVTLAHTKAHFNRAVLEGVGFSLLDSLVTLDKLGIARENQAQIIGGGAKSGLWRQIIADILGLTLCQPENSDSSLGAAMLAGVAMGIFTDFDDAVRNCCRTCSFIEPDAQRHEDYGGIFTIYKQIQAALAPIYHQCSRLQGNE